MGKRLHSRDVKKYFNVTDICSTILMIGVFSLTSPRNSLYSSSRHLFYRALSTSVLNDEMFSGSLDFFTPVFNVRRSIERDVFRQRRVRSRESWMHDLWPRLDASLSLFEQSRRATARLILRSASRNNARRTVRLVRRNGS